MNYGNIKTCDISNGPGIRVSLFVSGCRNDCIGCFNKDTHDFNYGKPFDSDAEYIIKQELEKDYVNGLTILGGEPFEEENQDEILWLINRIKDVYGDKKDIWIYTGYKLIEDLFRWNGKKHVDYFTNDKYFSLTSDILEKVDYIVDGPFMLGLKNPDLAYRGSENQHIINMHKFREFVKNNKIDYKSSRDIKMLHRNFSLFDDSIYFDNRFKRINGKN